MFPDQLWWHLRVRVDFPFSREALRLQGAGFQHTFAHRGGILRSSRAAQFLVLYRGNFDVNIDAVDEWTGNFGNVSLNLRRRAVALARGVSEKSAGARIHRRGQHKTRWKGDGCRGARDGHRTIFWCLPL